MAVYVDDMQAGYGHMKMCHMVADTDEELHAMVDQIGVARKWHQKPGTPQSHYDICLAKRAQAVRYGAQEITMRETGRIISRKREALTAQAALMADGGISAGGLDSTGLFGTELELTMEVLLMYGDGITGREYYLRVGTDDYPLIGPCGGSADDEQAARLKALGVLAEKHPDRPADALEADAVWNGWM
jgi:hypothetical protein